MIVSIHQPHFLPWLGYMNKALRSDAFVWLDTVQYRKNYFQNRTEIRNQRGERAWLTLPVHAPFGTPIDRVTLADPGARERVLSRVEQEYGRAPFFAECWPAIADAIRTASDSLSDVNLRAFQAVLGLLGATRPRVIRMGELGVEAEDPTERLVGACRALGATAYIAGRGGRNYLKTDEFERAGVEVIWQDFHAEAATYPQPGGAFLAGLSVIDCLFQNGPQPTFATAFEAWSPQGVSGVPSAP